MAGVSNPWKRRFEPAHRKPKDRLRGAQLAPVQRVEPVLCVSCADPRLIHRDNLRCLRVGCECERYVEAPA